MKMQNLSEEAKQVVSTMSSAELWDIRNENPLKNVRNKAVRKLRSQGVKIPLITQISGISKSTVHRIGFDIPQEELDTFHQKQIKTTLDKIYDFLVEKFQ